MQQIDLIRDCCNKHPTSDIMNHRVDVKTLTWLAGQTHNMLELIDYQAAAWLRDHEQDIAGKLFENVEPMYIRGHPGHFQPFMMAWCERNGGI